MKRGLQITMALLSLIPLRTVIRGFMVGAGWGATDELFSIDFESHYRYLSAFYISLPLFAWWIIPNIEQHTVPVRIIAFAIFLGGVNRLVALLTVGVPSTLPIIFLVLELIFPLFAVLQAQLISKPSRTLITA